MSYKKTLWVIAAASAIGPLVAACGSSSGSPSDGGLHHHEGGGAILDDGGGDVATEAGPPADGTTGKACASNADCIGDSGAGVNHCSNEFALMIGNQQLNPWPTPICLIPPAAMGNCDPAPPTDPMGQQIHFCDGPDMATSPGICIPDPVNGIGTCHAKCTYGTNGAKPVGCVGKDTCSPAFIVSNNNVGGYIGFCEGTCEADADCAALGAGVVCQKDIGFCTTKAVTRTKALGIACTNADTSSGACVCLSNPSTMIGYGYCSSSCIIGGLPCPNGWVCDNGQTPTTTLGNGVVVAPTAENVGTPGFCYPPCGAGDAGAPGEAGAPSDAGAVDGAVACPQNSTCTSMTLSGPICTP
jgi:hypothetical protein